MRAFSCAAILRAEYEPWNYHYNDGSTCSTTIQLVLSLDALPVDLNREAARDFAWLMLKSDPEEGLITTWCGTFAELRPRVNGAHMTCG